MYSAFLTLHNVLRWAVALAGLWAFLAFLAGWLGGRPFTAAHARARTFFSAALGIQFLLGVLLYATSPIVRLFWSDAAAGMREPQIRYFGLEHALTMIVAVVLAEIGSRRSRRGEDRARLRAGAIFFGLSLVLIAIRTPWAARPLFRWFGG